MKPIQVDDELLLRPPHDSDAEAVFRCVDENRESLAPWLPWVAFTESVNDTLTFFADSRSRREAGIGATFLILDQGEIQGVTGFHEIKLDESIGEIGYWLGAAGRGRGLVTRAVSRIIDWGFGEDNDGPRLERITIRAATKNRPSRAVPERLDFIERDTQAGAEEIGGQLLDYVRYTMDRSDWKARQAS